MYKKAREMTDEKTTGIKITKKSHFQKQRRFKIRRLIESIGVRRLPVSARRKQLRTKRQDRQAKSNSSTFLPANRSVALDLRDYVD